MNPFNDSLISKTRFLGLVLALFIFLMLFITYKASVYHIKKIQILHAITISDLLINDNNELKSYLEENNIVRVDASQIKKKLEGARSLISDDSIRKIFFKSGIELSAINDSVYYTLKTRNGEFYFKSDKSFISAIIAPLGFSAIIFALLLYGVHYYISKALTPLIRLNKNIERFSKEEDVQVAYENANDEISNVANAFYSAIECNKKLKSQKDVYLHTIMHEINTPLTKAKFITHFMRNEEEKNKLNALFNSIQDELSKLSEFENVNTKILKMKTSSYSLKALVEDVCDALQLREGDFSINEIEVNKTFDYSLLIVAIKNLIDNAIKYSKNSQVEIIIDPHCLQIRNLSVNNEPLNEKKLLEPFKQTDKRSGGMGLGLHLAYEIIEKHNFQLKYSFSNNYHIFKLYFD